MAITATSPTSTGGKVTSYNVTPPLPAGLFMDPNSGVISGTPIPVTATTIYTVTASNSASSTTAPVTSTVNVAPPKGLSYLTPTAFYTKDVEIPENVPTSTGGAPASYTVSGTLPGGLLTPKTVPAAIFASTGILTGTPTSTGAGTYTVTATNGSGSTTTTISITVSDAGADSPPAGLAYSAPAPVYAAGVAITPDVPSCSLTSGTPTSYRVSPPLPSGLTLDPQTGIVTGTASAPTSTIIPTPPFTATYTVTASNSAGSTTAPLTITLYSTPQSVPNMAQFITPLRPDGSSFQFLDTGNMVADPIDAQVAPVEWLAGQAVSTAVSPDHNTLLILTSGYNRVFQGPFPLFDPLYSSEYVFIYDISNHSPVFQQAVPIPNAYHGIVWDPIIANHAFYVSGGMGDAPFGTDPIPYPLPNNGDNVHIIAQDQATKIWSQVAELDLGQNVSGQTVVGGHPSGNGLPVPNNQFASVISRCSWLLAPPAWLFRTTVKLWSSRTTTTTQLPYSPAT